MPDMPDSEDFEEPFDMAPTPAAELVGLSPDTLASYAQSGRLPSRRTPGGHRRYRRSDVLALMTPEGAEAAS